MRKLSAFVTASALLVGAPAHAASVDECLDASERGQQLERAGKLTAARERFAICAQTSCPAPVRASCTRWAEQVRDRMPSIVIAVRDDSDLDVKGASVMIDGTAAPALEGQSISLDPGNHTLRVTAPGVSPVERNIVVVVGEKDRVVRVKLGPKAAAPPLATSSLPPEPKASSSSPSRVLPIVLGGISLASLGLSLGLGLDAKSQRDDIRDSRCAVDHTCNADDERGVRRQLLIADVALGAAVVAAALSVWFWVSAPSGRTSVNASAR